jgi:hypothetical protein
VANREIPRRLDTVWLAIAALALLGLAVFASNGSKHGILWDLSVYRRAVADYHANVDPYRTNVYFPLVYHPLVLRLFVLLNAVLPLKLSLLSLEWAAFAWFVFELVRTPVRLEGHGNAPEPKILAIVAAGAFGGIGIPVLLSGNITSFMHLALLASLLRSKRIVSLGSAFTPYALLCLFVVIKPYFLVYLALPVLLCANKKTALLRSVAVVAIAAVAWFSFDWLRPTEYAHFIQALRYATLDKGDLGYSFFGFFNKLTYNLVLALALHAVACVLLLAAVLFLLAGRYSRDGAFVPSLFLVYFVLTLVNPRMKDYDLFPALIGLLLVFGLAPRRAALGTLAGLLLSFVPLLAPLFQELSTQHPLLFDPYGTWQDIGLVAIGAAFVVGMLRKGTISSP